MDNTFDFLTSRPQEFQQIASKDLLFLHYKCPQDVKHIFVYNHFNQIVFTLEGQKIVHCGEQCWRVTEEDTHFAKKGAWKQENSDLQWKLLAFYFPDEFLSSFYREYQQELPTGYLPEPPGEKFIILKINEAARAFFHSVIPYFSQQNPPSESLMQLKFKELLFNILSNPDNAGLLAYVRQMSGYHKPPIPEIMESNFYFNLSIEEYARIAQRSLSSFKRDFMQLYKTTPGKWLTERRLGYAKFLLETSPGNVNETAYNSGFENVSHFSRVFKEKFGYSPLHYRRQNDQANLIHQ
jgi:AraC family transcriptional regulator, exoenzyme S synthesis regulatory protein ExsA